MKTSITRRLASFDAARVMTFATLLGVASSALPQAAAPVLASSSLGF